MKSLCRSRNAVQRNRQRHAKQHRGRGPALRVSEAEFQHDASTWLQRAMREGKPLYLLDARGRTVAKRYTPPTDSNV